MLLIRKCSRPITYYINGNTMSSTNKIDHALAYQFLFLWIGEKKQWWKTNFLNDISLQMIKPLAYHAHSWSTFKTLRAIVRKIEQQQHENHITLLRPHPKVQTLIDERINNAMKDNITPYSLLSQIGCPEDFWRIWSEKNPSLEEITSLLSTLSTPEFLQNQNSDLIYQVEDTILQDISSITHLFFAVDFTQPTYLAPALFWEL